MENAKNKIKEFDMFGHTISLNFDRQGDTYNTVIGGICSMIIKVFLTAYVVICFKRLLFFEKDEITTTVGLQDLSQMKDRIQSDNLNSLFFYVVRKQGGVAEGKTVSEELNKHLDFYFEEEYADYNKPSAEIFTRTRVATKNCTLDDFGRDE